jgi:hypothetical protein
VFDLFIAGSDLVVGVSAEIHDGRSAVQAVLRVNSFDPGKLAAGQKQLEEFNRLHSAQPGFLGSVTVDLGEGRQFVLNLWDSEEHRIAGLGALGPAVERLVNPLLARPSELIGFGPVVASDGLPATAALYLNLMPETASGGYLVR